MAIGGGALDMTSFIKEVFMTCEGAHDVSSLIMRRCS